MDSMGSFGRFLRDRAYDAVYELGDTSLQFLGDMFRGYNEDRHQAFAHRQISRYEGRNIPKVPKPTKSAQASRPAPETPLSYAQKQSLVKMMGRQAGESIIEHWRRRKQLLQYPDKPSLIAQHDALEMRLNTEEKHEHSIHAEMRSLASQYQKNRIAKKHRSNNRSKKRGMKR
jgi:hypothetical protein